MAWRINKQGGIFKKGAAFPLQKRYQIAVSYLRTGSFAAAAAENLCTHDAARKITDKFLMTGLFDPGNRGSPPTIMPPWKVAYLEALVTHNPFMYLCEMQAALRDDLNLPPAEVPSEEIRYLKLFSNVSQNQVQIKIIHFETSFFSD